MADSLGSTLAAASPSKPIASQLDEWERQKLARAAEAKAATPFMDQYATAASRLATTASGVPSAALQASEQASRESLSRQANNLRMTTAQGIASAGQIGQGSAVRAAQGTEGTIMQRIADARLAERTAAATEAQSANADLIQGAQSERTAATQADAVKRQALLDLVSSGSAAQKMQAQVGLQNLAGVSMGANTDAINDAAYKDAISNPEYQLQQSQAATTLAKSQREAADYKTEQTYAPFKEKAQGSIENFDGRYVNAFRVKAPIGSIVMVDGKPLQYLSRDLVENISDRVGTHGSMKKVAERYSLKFKDPVTGEIIVKEETKK